MAELMSGLLFMAMAMAMPLVIGLALAVAIGSVIHTRTKRRKRLSRLADAWGLQHKDLELFGEYEGAKVTLRHVPGSDNSPTRTVLEVGWPYLSGLLELKPERMLDGLAEIFGTPEIQVGDAEVDAAWRIHGVEETARGILLDPGVQAALRVFSGEGAFRGSRFTARRKGDLDDRSEELLAWGARLAGEVDRARRAPWEAVAARHGLEIDAKARAMRGSVHGVSVAVREVLHNRVIYTEITVALPTPLASGASITRKGEGSPLRDPVLDGNIAVRGEVDVLRPRLTTDEGRAAVMAVVHGHPESEVTSEHVILRGRGRLMGSLGEAVTDAVSLARVLGGQPVDSRAQQAQRESS